MNPVRTRRVFKLVLLGESGVGKTSLLTLWMTGRLLKSSGPTIGATHQRRTLKFDGEDVDLFLWDTAGQEQFRSLTPLYARSCSVAVLVTSIIDPLSFQTVDRWVSLLEGANDTVPPIVLAVNKMDLASEGMRSTEELEIEFRGRFAAIFFVSAMTGEEVDNLFQFAAATGYHFNSTPAQPTITPMQKREDGCC